MIQDTPTQRRSVKTSVCFDSDLLARFRRLADARGLTVNQYLYQLMRREVGMPNALDPLGPKSERAA